MTFNDLFLEYLILFSSFQSQSEIINKKNRYKNHIKKYIGHKNIQDIKFKDCQEICNNIINVKKLSPKTAKNVNVIIQAVFNYAIKNDYIDKNPASYTIIPKFDNKYDIKLSDKQISNLINEIIKIDNLTYKTIFLFALHGRRLNEILSLQWYQIDLENKTYNIPPQKNKSKKNDIHKMTNLLYTHIQVLANTKPSISLNDYVFINPKTGTRFKDIRKFFKTLKNKAGIDVMRFHDFRHILGTQGIKKGIPIEHISQALGHSGINVTQKYITKDYKISSDVVNNILDEYIQ